MRLQYWLIGTVAILATACQPKPPSGVAKVQILPNGTHIIGEQRVSTSAEAVAAVMRVNPADVDLLYCVDTPSKLVDEFTDKLTAKSNIHIVLGISDEGCSTR